MLVEPGEPLSVGGIERQVDHRPALGKPPLDLIEQPLLSLPGQRRHQDRTRIAVAATSAVGDDDRTLGVEQVELVPDLHEPAMIRRVDTEIAEDTFDIRGLRFRILVRDVRARGG